VTTVNVKELPSTSLPVRVVEAEPSSGRVTLWLSAMGVWFTAAIVIDTVANVGINYAIVGLECETVGTIVMQVWRVG